MPIRGLKGEAYRESKTVYHNNYAESKWTDLMPEGQVKLSNVLVAPLVHEGRTVGVMGFANKRENFSENDAQLATLFAELAAIVPSTSMAKQRWQKEDMK